MPRATWSTTAPTGNPYANSVSSYNRLYNFLWFNNGYHQEHHWDPKCHWTRMHALHEELRPQLQANGTKIRGPHLTGLVEDWWTAKVTPKTAASEPPGHSSRTPEALATSDSRWQTNRKTVVFAKLEARRAWRQYQLGTTAP